MTSRRAFIWIVIALLFASALLSLAIVLNRLRPPESRAAIDLIGVQASSMALPLDATGAGMQVISGATLSVKLDPFPPRANAESTLTLVALDRQTQAVKVITPTLTVAELTQVNGVDYAMIRQNNGAYVARGRLFPASGEWRLRVRINLGAGEDYSMLMLVDAR